MIRGPITIRWTKDVQAEQVKRDDAKRVSARLVELLMHTHRQDKAILRRWGLSEGLNEAQGVKGSKPPKGAVASVL